MSSPLDVKEIIRKRALTETTKKSSGTGTRVVVASQLKDAGVPIETGSDDRWIVVTADTTAVTIKLSRHGLGTVEIKRHPNSKHNVNIISDTTIEGFEAALLDSDSSFMKLRWFEGHWLTVG